MSIHSWLMVMQYPSFKIDQSLGREACVTMKEKGNKILRDTKLGDLLNKKPCYGYGSVLLFLRRDV
jgi:hypothetical protein